MLRMARMTPIGSVVRGMIAGAVGTAAMDLRLYGQHRRQGGTSALVDWEFSRGMTWETAAAPAQVGRMAAERVLGAPLSDATAPLVNNLVHWGYGIAWGGLFGLVEGRLARPRAGHGMPFALTVWLSGYAVLPLLKLYRPIWEYEPGVLWKDLQAHLTYGSTTAGILRLLAGRD